MSNDNTIKAKGAGRMKANVPERKPWLTVLVSLIPAVLNIVLYRFGIWFWIAGLPLLLIVMIVANRVFFKTIFAFRFAQRLVGISLFVSGCISTLLYYCLVSRDHMTILAGFLFTVFGVTVSVSVMSCVRSFRGVRERKNQDGETK